MTEKQKREMMNEKIAMRVSTRAIIENVILAVIKFVAGILGHSLAMLSDAVHSLSDVISTFIVMAGIKMSRKENDKEHPYGHERLECVAAILLAVVLFATGIGIGYKAISTILVTKADEMVKPGIVALVAAVVSILIKENMYHYTKKAAKQINSGALMADAWHHRSDALSSIASLIGIAGARYGMPILDSIAGVVICLFIARAAYLIFKDAIKKMMDCACDEETAKKMRDIILEQEGVVRIDVLKTRLFGDKIYVDVEISVDGKVTLYESHAIAHNVHDLLEERFEEIKHCMVHVNSADV